MDGRRIIKMTEIFFPLAQTSEKQHCDKAKMEEGEKTADGAINVCLRGPRKNLIIPGVFSCRSCEYAKARERRIGCSEGRAVNSIFAFPTEDGGPSRRSRQRAKKKGVLVRSCHLRRPPRFCEG